MLNRKPDGCKDCPLYKNGFGFTPAEGNPKTAQLTILLDAPEESTRAKAALEGWLLNPLNIPDSGVFVDHVLRCVPPMNKKGEHYPTGDERKQAEACCRQYDHPDMRPTVGIVTIDPSSLVKTITPLPLVLADVQKCLDFARAGEKPILLAGSKAATYWLGQETNVYKWRGHYAPNTKGAQIVRARRVL